MIIAAVGRALPRHRYEQDTIRSFLAGLWSEEPALVERMFRMHGNACVQTRHLALPLEAYRDLDTFGRANDAWIAAALDLGQTALEDALQRCGLSASDVDALFTVSVTGIASPALDARLMNRMPLRHDLKRIPIFGLGCVAGVAGIARAADYVRAFPDQIAVLLSVELCSLTFQRDDTSTAHVISAGLFGDGAAAVVVLGAERARRMGLSGAKVLATRSVFYPDTEHVMGWQISEQGFRIVLSAEVPRVAREFLGPDVDRFLADHGLDRSAIGSWICHPGGPKVLQAMQDSLDLTDHDVRFAREILARQGNLSSTSVLMVLREVFERARPGPGERSLLIAMGPAFCSEIVMAEW
ncbi:MAG: 3-oxoacyl-[acyl-carrier-protein] synthase III C-terminal domain-containing protein [Planctomycetota bacterium]